MFKLSCDNIRIITNFLMTIYLFYLQQAYNAIAVSRQMKLLALASSNRNNSTSESSCEQKTTEAKEVSASECCFLIIRLKTVLFYNMITTFA